MSNINSNRVNAVMTATQVAAVKTALQTILANMPFLTGLTVEERMVLPKISVSNRAFAEDALLAVENNAGMLPAYLTAVGMRNDLTLYTQLDELLGLVRQLHERMEDTQMLAGSEAYVSALAAYKLFTAAAEAGMPGMDAVRDQLRARFAGQGPTGKTEAPDTPPTT